MSFSSVKVACSAIEHPYRRNGLFLFCNYYRYPGARLLFACMDQRTAHFIEVMLLEIGFIGAGKVGKALGLYFSSHGLNVSGYYSRTYESAKDAAVLTSSTAFNSIKSLADSSNVIFITVPDQALPEIDCEAASAIGELESEPCFIHSSGAFSSDILAELKMAGFEVGSIHPLMSFGDPYASAERLNGTWFTLEGTDKAVSFAGSLLERTGGKFFLIKAEDKPLYHAGASVVSNFLVTLLESGIRLFEATGMDRDDVLHAILPLIDATISNIRKKGTIGALTGPIVRGDYDTVRVHLKAIGERMPSELELYRAMALKTAQMLDGKRLTHGQSEEFIRILEVEADGR